MSDKVTPLHPERERRRKLRRRILLCWQAWLIFVLLILTVILLHETACELEPVSPIRHVPQCGYRRRNYGPLLL